MELALPLDHHQEVTQLEVQNSVRRKNLFSENVMIYDEFYFQHRSRTSQPTIFLWSAKP